MKTMPDKTDGNDARALAQIMRTGWFRQAHVTSRQSRLWRSLLVARRTALNEMRSIKEVLQSRHFRSGDELETTLRRYVRLCNQKLPQSAPGDKSPLQAMKDWRKLKPKLFGKQPCDLPGCDS